METGMTMYDIDRQIVEQMKPNDIFTSNRIIGEISKKIFDKNIDFLLLICPDLRQYVFFHIKNTESTCSNDIEKNLRETLYNRGQIVFIDCQEEDKNLWEFWVRDKYDNKLYVYQLMDYTEGVVRI